MSIEAGIQITDVQDEDLVRIAGENLKAILALYSDIKVEAGGTIIVSTRNGTRIKLETVFQKILEINDVELRATVINSNPIKRDKGHLWLMFFPVFRFRKM